MADAIFDFIFKNNVDGDTGKQQVLWVMFKRYYSLPCKELASIAIRSQNTQLQKSCKRR